MRTLHQILYSLQEARSGIEEVASFQELRDHADYQALLAIVKRLSDSGFFLEIVRHELAGKILGRSTVEQTFSPVKWLYAAGLLHGQRLREGVVE